VVSVDVLTTTFSVLTSGKHLIIPNATLNGSVIENLSRNPSRTGGTLPTATIKLDISVPLETTHEQLTRLQAHLIAYIHGNKENWKPEPPVFFRIRGTDEKGLHLTYLFFSRHRWGDMPTIYDERVKLHVHL